MEETEDSGGGTLFSEHKEVENTITMTAPSGGIYIENDEIIFQIKHPYNLSVTGTPLIHLDVGGAPATAQYTSGNGTKTLVFKYTVTAGDNDADGIQVSPSTIDLNGGTIQFTGTTGTQASALSFTPPSLASVFVDTTAPGEPVVTAAPNLTYYLGQQLTFRFLYDEPVFVTGVPQLEMTVGADTVYANYVSGSGSDTLVFKYTVTSTDYDLNGIALSSPLLLNSGTIKDQAGNNAALTYTLPNTTGVRIDGDTPLVETFIPPVSDTYTPGEHLDFSLQFTEAVNVVGTPRVEVDIGGEIVYADYISGTGSDTLVFRYSIIPGNVDEDGVDVTNTIDLNGGSIQDTGANPALWLFDPPATTGAIVDAPLPVITSISLPNPPADGYFNSGEEIYITVNFNEPVDVLDATPQLGMQLDSSGSTIFVDYSGGSGTSSLVFRYVVVDEVDEDHDGITLVSPLELNGSRIQNANGTNIDTDMTDVVAALDTSSILVDATTPTVDSITPPNNDTYAIGEQIDFVINFSEIVTVNPTPRIALDVGGAVRYATYAGGSGSANLTFRWTVQNTYEDLDGIELTSAAIAPMAGIIEDRGGNEANYDISGVIPNTGSVLVDGIRPEITSVTIPGGTYNSGQTITATVTFDDVVDVAGGNPVITGTFEQAGGGTNFVQQTGTGSSTLTFDYTVVAGDEDTDGIDLAAAITFGASTIQDINGNDVVPALSDTNFPAVLIDAVGPEIAITSPADGDFITTSNDSATFGITATCDDAGATYDILINGVSDPGQLNVTCNGTNLTGTFDTTGIGEGAFTLQIEGEDTYGNISLSPSISLDKDTLAPSITSVNSSAGDYVLNDNIDFTVNFDDTVDITGTRIAITTDTATVYANYLSGTGTASAIYRYTVGASDYDADGVVLGATLDLNGGSVTDDSGNPLDGANIDPPGGAIRINDGTPAFQWYDEAMNPVATFNYVDDGVVKTQTFTVENTGTAPSSSTITVTLAQGATNYAITQDNCEVGISLGINETCTVQIQYDPNTGGPKSNTANVDDPGFTITQGLALEVAP